MLAADFFGNIFIQWLQMMVGVTGFEPATSSSQNLRPTTELHPDEMIFIQISKRKAVALYNAARNMSIKRIDLKIFCDILAEKNLRECNGFDRDGWGSISEHRLRNRFAKRKIFL